MKATLNCSHRLYIFNNTLNNIMLYYVMYFTININNKSPLTHFTCTHYQNININKYINFQTSLQ